MPPTLGSDARAKSMSRFSTSELNSARVPHSSPAASGTVVSRRSLGSCVRNCSSRSGSSTQNGRIGCDERCRPRRPRENRTSGADRSSSCHPGRRLRGSARAASAINRMRERESNARLRHAPRPPPAPAPAAPPARPAARGTAAARTGVRQNRRVDAEHAIARRHRRCGALLQTHRLRFGRRHQAGRKPVRRVQLDVLARFAAEQLIERHVQRLALDVPEREVDARRARGAVPCPANRTRPCRRPAR